MEPLVSFNLSSKELNMQLGLIQSVRKKGRRQPMLCRFQAYSYGRPLRPIVYCIAVGTEKDGRRRSAAFDFGPCAL